MRAVRRQIREIAYLTPLHRWLGLGKTEFDERYWNEKLAGQFRPHLGGTVSVEVRNGIVRSLIALLFPQARSVLDVGCASGSLARALGSDFFYTGVDISEYAIAQARQLSPNRKFYVSRLDEFELEGNFDIIAFNEVLYYCPVEKAASELRRYAAALREGGAIIISMKDDPKARAILSLAQKEFHWNNGILYQEKVGKADYIVRPDSERPAYLVGVLSRRQQD